MPDLPPRRLTLAVFAVAMATLVVELALTRVFDVILTPKLGYLVIGCAILSFAFAGAWRTLRPAPRGDALRRSLVGLALALAVASVAVLPAFNLIPFDYDKLYEAPLAQGALFFAMYLVAALPFFLGGLFLVQVFSAYAGQIRRLYA